MSPHTQSNSTDPAQDDEHTALEYGAQRLQQTAAGKRLTYLTSSGNGSAYSSRREETDLCSSGEFTARFVSQTSGYGASSEDVWERTGTWRVVAMEGRLVLEMNTQQSSDNFTGTDL